MDNQQLLTVLLWGLGSCITGFLFLSGWILKLSAGINAAVKLIDIENKRIEKDVMGKVSTAELTKIMQPTNMLLQQIKDVLYGDQENVGYVHIMRQQQNKCKEHMKKYHGESND